MTSVDLPSTVFPFTIEIFDRDTGALLQKETVAEPGCLRIKGWGGQGITTRTKVTYANGQVIEA